jgi:5-methylcytosine-specific restriction protein A
VATFLFSWNPSKWEWMDDDLTEKILQVAETGSARDSWSSGKRKDLPIGSRFFLIRLGREPRGLIGSGVTLSNPKYEPHWDSERRAKGEETLFVDLKFDFLSKVPVIFWQELQSPPLTPFNWGIQASGVQIPDRYESSLEEIWHERTGRKAQIQPDCYRRGVE